MLHALVPGRSLDVERASFAVNLKTTEAGVVGKTHNIPCQRGRGEGGAGSGPNGAHEQQEGSSDGLGLGADEVQGPVRRPLRDEEEVAGLRVPQVGPHQRLGGGVKALLNQP